MYNDINLPPFYIGQKVVGSDSVMLASMIKKGQPYVISSLQYKNCNSAKIYCWYVGVEGNDNIWMTPRLFTPIDEFFQSITLEKVLENETGFISVN